MNYPGENKLILTADALKDLIGQALNGLQQPHMRTVRVLTVGRSGYGSDMEFTITTDPIPTTTETKEI